MKFLVELTKNVRNVTELEIYSYICGMKNELLILCEHNKRENQYE